MTNQVTKTVTFFNESEAVTLVYIVDSDAPEVIHTEGVDTETLNTLLSGDYPHGWNSITVV